MLFFYIRSFFRKVVVVDLLCMADSPPAQWALNYRVVLGILSIHFIFKVCKMSENRPLVVPSKGKGTVIEVLCVLMALASLGGGVVGAIALGKVEVDLYGLITRAEYVPELVTYWLIGGVVSALAWYVLSGIGTLINWHEFNHRNSA